MDHPRSTIGNGEDNVGIPEDLRCKRSDGKQWRCSAMSMPDKTVCEKHYIQAKKRAANSALRASLKKAKRKSLGESDVYLESKSDDFDMPVVNAKAVDYPVSVSVNKYREKPTKKRVRYSPETPPVRNVSIRKSVKPNDDSQRETHFEENRRAYRTPPLPVMDSSRTKSRRSLDVSAVAVSGISFFLSFFFIYCCYSYYMNNQRFD